MRPRQDSQGQSDLFRARLDQILDHGHPLFQLAHKIHWHSFDMLYADCYSEDFGAPAKAIRLMVGLHYLKHAFNESDESVVAKWVENPYWQYFCGCMYMEHEFPIHPTSMTKFRHRVGEERMILLLKETVEMALREGHIRESELEHVTVDTTVQEKNITFPTDSKLLHRAIIKLGNAAMKSGIQLRQSYCRVAKRAQIRASRYAHAKQYGRMRRQIRFLRTRLGRLIRDVERKAGRTDGELDELLDLCWRLHGQKRTDKNKLYSLHEPHVQCISKGKAHKRYEFGNKVAVAVTNRGDWFLAAESLQGNPYDGHTLSRTLGAVETVTGVAIKHAYVDKGYRGHDYTGKATVHIAGQSTKSMSSMMRKRRRRRSAIEPKIGHAKSENRLGRCFLKGIRGDAINAVLAAAGANFRKLLNAFLFLPLLLQRYLAAVSLKPRILRQWVIDVAKSWIHHSAFHVRLGS
jgi:transposase, IS5 family